LYHSVATVYGATVQSPPGYTGGQVAAASLLSFGVGMLLGAAINNNNNHWNTNWPGGSVYYNRNVYVSNSTVVTRQPYYGYRPPGAYPQGDYSPRRGIRRDPDIRRPATRGRCLKMRLANVQRITAPFQLHGPITRRKRRTMRPIIQT
jgi:hypothetical protein